MKKILFIFTFLVFIGAGCTGANVGENEAQKVDIIGDTVVQESVSTKVFKDDKYGVQFNYLDIYDGSEFCRLTNIATIPNSKNAYQVKDVDFGQDISLNISNIDATNIRGVLADSLASGLTIRTQEYTLVGENEALHLTYNDRGLGQPYESYVFLNNGFLYNISRHSGPESCAIQKLGDEGIESVFAGIVQTLDFN